MSDRVGQQLGNYRLVRLLGQGGFADVYLAEHIHLGTQAAIKVLSIRLNSDNMEHFRTEARTIARLVHPHIVRVLDFGLEDNTPYLVMDYAANGTLRQSHPKGSRLPLETVVSYVKQISEALQYAHEKKLIHRDIKPENMLLGEHYEVLLSDFGIALVAQSTHYQNTQEIIGTAAYMAPEQLQGKPRRASDQYALGIVVYEWICGDRPFHGSFTELYSQHLFVSPQPLCEKAPELPSAVEGVVLTALAKDPKQRFASVEAFATALEQASQTSQVSPGVSRSLPQTVPTPPLEQSTSVTQPAKTVLDSPSHAEPTSSPHEAGAATSLPVPNTTSVVPGTIHKRGFSKGKTALLIGLALLIVGSVSLLYTTVGNNVASPRATATVSAKTHTTGTANIYATATAATSAYDTAATANGVMFGFDAQHTSFNSYEKVLDATNVSELVQDWTASTQGPITSSPAGVNGVVYVGSDDGKLYAFKAPGCGSTFCSPIWTASVGPSGYSLTSSPAVANGVVYIGSYVNSTVSNLYGKLYAFNAKTGATIWTASTTGIIYTPPAIADGMVYVGTNDGKLDAFSTSGCSQTSCSPVWTAPIEAGLLSSPAVANGVIYCVSDGKGYVHMLYAFNAKSGAALWTASVGDPNNVFDSSPAVANGVVYIGSNDHKVYAFNASTGKILWAASTGGQFNSSPAVANGTVYIGSDDGKLYALKASGCGSASCSPLWMVSTEGSIGSSPTVANGVVYIGSSDHKLYAFNASTGTTLWMVSTGGSIYSSPAVVIGVVYVGSNDGGLYAFHLPGMTP